MSASNIGPSVKISHATPVEEVRVDSSPPSYALPPAGVEGGIASANLLGALERFTDCCNQAGVNADQLTQQQRKHVIGGMWEWLDRNPAASMQEAANQLILELEAFARPRAA